MSETKPNILVIWGDDIGISNLSCYTMGLMGYQTPNIDRIAKEGMLFTDSYGEQSCTAGRASFITGQSVYRTGMSKVGMPGVDIGLSLDDPTTAELLKPLGYATGQFGKNHLGDLNKYLPTNRGFDEFIHSWATEEESKDVDPRYGPVGKQKIEDTGLLTSKRMETVDEETTAAAIDFIKRQHKAETPFFVWMNMTHMHFKSHTKPGSVGQAGRWQSNYHDTMIDHDKNVGQLVDLLDELGIAEDTILVYSTDNGPHRNTWPDGGTTPFRSEKVTNWEGAFRIPEMVRWPGKIKAGSVSNEIIQHHDWLPTFLAAAGEPEIVEKLLKGYKAGDKKYKVHIDGYNLLPYLTGEVEKSPRRGMIYFSDDCDVLGIRAENWKVVFAEQRCKGTLQVWFEPFTKLRAPKLFNLRTDPYEFADITSNSYWEWYFDRDFLVFFASAIVTQFLDTFKEFPPSHPPASFSIEHAVEELHTFLAARGG